LPGNFRHNRAYLRTSGMRRPKTGVYSLISLDILDGFSQSFHHMKALYVQMMHLCLIFQFIKGRFYGNLIILPLWRQTDITCNIYISRLCYDVSVRLSVRLSVTEVHCGHGACREHSGCASQRSWGHHTILNKHGRRRCWGCWLQQNDVTRLACCLRPCLLWEDLLTNRRLQTLLLLWLDVRSLESI